MEEFGSQIGNSEVTHLLAQQEATIMPLEKEEQQCLLLLWSWSCLAESKTMERTFLVEPGTTNDPKGEEGAEAKEEKPLLLPEMSHAA